MAGGIFIGLGQALQRIGADLFGPNGSTAQAYERKRQQEQDAIQKLLVDGQVQTMQANRDLAQRADQRAVRAEQSERVRDVLGNLASPTRVDSNTAKDIRESGYAPFVSDVQFDARTLPLEVAPGVRMKQQVLPSDSVTVATPFTPPALKSSLEASSRAAAAQGAQNERSSANLDLRERIHTDNVARDREMLNLREKFADISARRAETASGTQLANSRRAFEALVETEAKERFPVSPLEEITGIYDPVKAKQREEYKTRRLSELGFSGPAVAAPPLMPSHTSPTPGAASKAAQAAAIVRGRRR